QSQVTVRQLKCLRHVLNTDTQLRRFQSVDLDQELGLVEFEVDVDALQRGMVFGGFQKLEKHLTNLIKVVVLYNKLYRLTAPAVHLNRLIFDDKYFSLRETIEVAVDHLDNLRL